MNMIRLIVPSVLACLLLFCNAAIAAESSDGGGKPDWPVHLKMLTGPKGGQWFTMGEPIAEVLSRHVLPTTSRQGGGLSNIGDVGRKVGDMGFSLACFLGAASSGEEQYKNNDLQNVTLMATIYPQVFYFLLRKDIADKYGITSVESLLRQNIPLRFASLKPSTASEFMVSMLLKYGYGTNFGQLRKQGWTVSFNDYAETADNLVSGNLDCFAYTAGTVVPLIKKMEEYTDVVILPIEAKVLDTLSAKFKTGTYIIQPGFYKSVTTPIPTLGDSTCIIIRGDLPDDLVSAVNKALWEDRDRIAREIKDFGGLSPDTALPVGLPTHPGSVKFWDTLRAK